MLSTISLTWITNIWMSVDCRRSPETLKLCANLVKYVVKIDTSFNASTDVRFWMSALARVRATGTVRESSPYHTPMQSNVWISAPHSIESNI